MNITGDKATAARTLTLNDTGQKFSGSEVVTANAQGVVVAGPERIYYLLIPWHRVGSLHYVSEDRDLVAFLHPDGGALL